MRQSKRAAKVYQKEHTHAAAKEVVAKDLGYSGINGRSLTQIGALRQYAILEGSSDALRISKDAIAYFELDDGPEKTDAMRRMALAPDLFAELSKLHIHSLPSDGNLRHELVSKGFSSKAADDVIKVYKANVELAKGEEGDYIGGEGNEAKEPPIVSHGAAVIPPTKPLVSPPTSVQSYAFALSPDARAELVLRGSLTADDLDLLRDHIELTIKALSNSEDRRAKQKKRIMTVAEFLCNGCEVQFQDHGSSIWFKVVKDGVELIPYSEDRTASFYEGLTDTELANRLKALGGSRI